MGCVVRIPDDAYFVSANQGRIQQLGIKDGKFTDGYKGSPDIVDFAVKMVLLLTMMVNLIFALAING